MTHSEELQVFAEVLRNSISDALTHEKQHLLLTRGVIATLEEISVETGGDEEANRLLFEAASEHTSEIIRRQAFRGLTRLAQDGQSQAVDLVYLLAIEKDLLSARQLILSRGWQPTRVELRALFNWFTALAAGSPFPEDQLEQITHAFFEIASPAIQQRMLSSAADLRMVNWARIVTALQSGSMAGLHELVDRYPSFSGRERRLAIDQLSLQAQRGLPAAQETLCLLFIRHEDQQVKQTTLANGYLPEDPEQRALFLFLVEDWEAYQALDFNHNLLTNAYENAAQPQRRHLMEHSRKTGQSDWLRGLGSAGEVRWLNDLTDADWEMAIRRLLESDKNDDLWRLAQLSPATWSAVILDRLSSLGWAPDSADASTAFSRLAALARDCLKSPLTIRSKKTLFTNGANITCLAIHPEGKVLAAGSNDQRILLWDLPDGDLQPEPLLGPVPVTRSLVFSPDGSLVAGANSDNRIRVFRWLNGQMLKTLEGHQAMVRALVIHPDGRTLFSAGFDGQIRFWRFPYGPELKVLEPGCGEIFSLALGSKGRQLMSGGTDGQVRVWTVPEGALARQITGQQNSITHLSANPGGDLVACAGRNERISLWNFTSGGLVRAIDHQAGPVTALCLHPNEQVLFSGHQNGTIALWNLSTGMMIDQLAGHQNPINAFVITPDGNILFSSDPKGKILAWDLGTFLTIHLAKAISRPGAAADLLERSQHPHLSAVEKKWLDFAADLARWRQRFDIELSDSNLEMIRVGEFDIELS